MEQNNTNQESRNKTWLEEMSQQSWNPELIISGIAIYATFSMPDVFKKVYNSYFIDYQLDESVGNAVMPMLIYGVLVSLSQVLSVAFIVHFVLRAFWVGYIGVLSVFPKGIDFEKITLYGDYGKQQLQKKMKNLDELALQLDKASSVIFALAILVVLQFCGIGLVYFIFALLHNLLQHLFTKSIYEKYEDTIQFVLLALIFVPVAMILILNQKRFRNHPVYGKWHYHVSRGFQKVLMPFFNIHIQSLLLTFNSTIPRSRLVWISSSLGLIFGAMISLNLLNLRATNLLEGRHFYTSYVSETYIAKAFYEDKRNKDDLRIATIQSDVIKDPYVKLFIAYPKRVDAYLDSLYQQPVYNKKYSKYENRLQSDKQKLKNLEDFYKIQLNDSLLEKKEFMFYEFPEGDKGVMTYIPAEACKL
jgi:hypothetical protein